MKEKNLTQGRILPTLTAFALPVLLALFLQAMYGAADLMIVGRFAGTGDQSGVATGSQFFHMVTMVITGLSVGVTVFVGEAIGADKRQEAGKGIGTALFLFTLIAVCLTLLIVPLSPVLARLMHAPESAFSQTAAYIRICGIGTVFIVAYNLLGAVFRGIGDSKTPLMTVSIACAVNIAGDLILVGIFHMGAAGAAIATISAQAFSVVISFIIIRKKSLPFELSKTFIHPDISRMKRILLVGLPIALQEMLVQFSFLFIQVIVNTMGVTASAAVGVAEKVCMFLMLVASAYMQSIAAFVAQNNGAGQYTRSRSALFISIGTAFIAGVITGSIAFFFGSELAAVFSNAPEVIAAAHDYLKAYAIDCLLTALLFCFIGYFNGCEHTVFVMIQGIVGAFCVRIPAVYLISHISDVSLFYIGLGTPLSTIVQILLCFLAYRYFNQRLPLALSEN